MKTIRFPMSDLLILYPGRLGYGFNQEALGKIADANGITYEEFINAITKSSVANTIKFIRKQGVTD